MKALERLPDWEQRLNEYVAAHFHDVHGWEGREGEIDCATFAIGAVEAVTGVDVGKPFRGKYRSEKQANAVIRKNKAPNLAALVETILPLKRRANAQRGDVVLNDEGNLAVVWAGGVALCPGDGPQLVRVTRENWRKAWAVG